MTLRIQIINDSDLPDALALGIAADMCDKFETGRLDPGMQPRVQLSRLPHGSYWVRVSERDKAGLVFSVTWEPAASHRPRPFGPPRLRLVASSEDKRRDSC